MPSLASALALLLCKANITSANDFADWLLRAPTAIANTIKTSAFQAEAEAIEALEAAEAANVAAEVEELRMQLDAARTTTAAVQDEASTARSLVAASVEAAGCARPAQDFRDRFSYLSIHYKSLVSMSRRMYVAVAFPRPSTSEITFELRQSTTV